MAVALVLQNIDPTRRRIKRTYRVNFSGNYVTGGDTINLALISKTINPNGLETASWGRKPNGFRVENFTPGFEAEIIPGSNLTNWKIKIWDNVAAAELAQAGYPVALSGDTNIRISFDGPIGV